MAGGTWTTQNKVRPGVYTNTVSQSRPIGSIGERGIVAFPAALPWGPTGIIKITSDEFQDKALPLLGYRATDASIRHIAAAMAHANTLLLYGLGRQGAVKAVATVGDLTATAKYGGLRGNDLKVVIQQSLDVSGSFDVYTLMENEELDRQTVAGIADLVANDYIDWSGTGTLTATAGANLTGGTAGTSTGNEYSDALTAFEAEDFNVLGIPSEEQSIKQLAVAYTERLRNDGKKFTTMVIGYPQADTEGVTSLKNGIITDDGLTVPATSLIWEVAAMAAAARVNQSLTNMEIPNAMDAYPKYTNAEIIQALKDGEMVISNNKGRVVIEQDINTLTTFTLEKRKEFRKNRVLRVLDGLDNDLQATYGQYYLGKVDNNSAGRNLFKKDVIKYMTSLQDIGAIENFDSQTDIIIGPGEEKDAVVSDIYIQPVDSIEKIYQTVTVR
ncbi:phage tail sheath protein [Paenibacillus amylolyticus]|uniref:Phage tail sheath protein n=1 Tax=Paenibacillus amylolyticus TaxID=1451 RepID=A0A1R1C559_PAEAM|nr:phage tail sheath C-terminal domain-containing protein [Paenibacillus amylolyticus]OMF17246.1 phage tail sheath protein [Paenibacillus amylolyticus]